MKRILLVGIALFIMLSALSCAPATNPPDSGTNDKNSENPEEVRPVALTYEEMMQMASMGTSGLMAIYHSLEALREARLDSGNPFAYATVECVDIRYYVRKTVYGTTEFITVYDVKIVELHETFLEYPWKKGDVLTLGGERLTVYPKDDSTVCEYRVEVDENGESRIVPGDYEWIPTKENVRSIAYYPEYIPLKIGEQYVGVLSFAYGELDFLNYEMPIPEDCDYFVNNGYGMEWDSVFKKTAGELLDYVRTKEAE